MTAELVSIAILAVAGLPIARALAPDSRGTRLAGEAYLFGAGLVAVLLLLSSLAAVAWTPARLLVPMAIVSGIAAFVVRRRLAHAEVSPPLEPAPRYGVVAGSIDLVTVALFLCFVTFTTLAAPWEWDFWAIWGLKAKVFHAAGGIDWSFLESRWNAYAHGEYPPLVSLVYVVPALVRGEWSDRWLALMAIAFAAAALLVFRRHVLDETRDANVAAIATLAATGPACAGWVALADVPLLALGTAAVLALRRAISDDAAPAGLSGAVLLGLAALTKNEGVALLAAVALATLLTGGPRRMQHLVRLWPAFAIASLWQVPRLAKGLSADILAGGALSRLTFARLFEAVERIAAAPLHHPLFWLMIGVAFIAAAPALRKETFLLSILALQLGLVLLVYVVTANDIAWQVETSWRRVADQPALIALFIAVAAVARQGLGPRR